MKKIALVLMMMPFLAFQCKKYATDLLEGKVVRISCGSFVVQLLNDDKTGQDGWKDIFDNNKEYDNVINASNLCQIPATIQKGSIIQFRIKSAPPPVDCVICTIYDAPPNVSLEIKDIWEKK